MCNIIKYCTIIILAFNPSIGFSQTVSWDWDKNAGGGGDDTGYSVTTDNGNVIVVGRFNNTAYFDDIYLNSLSFHGGSFITKLDTNGNFMWADRIAGTNSCYLHSVCSDINNNIYVAGSFSETIYLDSLSFTSNGSADILISKYNNEGILQWAKSEGGIGLDGAMNIDCSDSLLYVAGEFKDSIYFDTTLLISKGGSDIFIASLDLDGNYKWIQQAGGSEWDVSRGIDIDNSSYIYLTGIFMDTAYFGESSSISSDGSSDAFLAKYDPNGNVQWVTSMIGTSFTWGRSVVNCDNNVYVMGHFEGNAQFGSFNLVSQRYSDYFICKFDEYGNIIWVKQIGVTLDFMDDIWNHSIETDEQGNLYITGYFKDSLVYDDLTVQSNGSYDIFVMKIDTDGNLLWCLTAGNDHSYGDYSRSIARDGNGNLYITGRFYDTLFFGDSSVTSYGSADVFIAKIREEPLSVNNEKNSLEINVYPNPAGDFFSIISEDNEIDKIEIINIKGECILSYNYFLNNIDVSELTKGIYFVRIITKNMTFTKKIIII